LQQWSTQGLLSINVFAFPKFEIGRSNYGEEYPDEK
jgi:hypothetical protein